MKRVLLAAAFAAMGTAAMAQAPALGLYAVKMPQADLARAVAFYEALGLHKGGAYHEGRVQMMEWNRPGSGSNISLNLDTSGKAASVGIVVTVADVRAAMEALGRAGFPVTGKVEDTPMSSIVFTKDPGGNSIEIAGPGPGTGAKGR